VSGAERFLDLLAELVCPLTIGVLTAIEGGLRGRRCGFVDDC
jgi:hypothetical protein